MGLRRSVDDVEGHRRAPFTDEPDDDVEGHLRAPFTDERTRTSRATSAPVHRRADDDVEGHRDPTPIA